MHQPPCTNHQDRDELLTRMTVMTRHKVGVAQMIGGMFALSSEFSRQTASSIKYLCSAAGMPSKTPLLLHELRRGVLRQNTDEAVRALSKGSCVESASSIIAGVVSLLKRKLCSASVIEHLDLDLELVGGMMAVTSGDEELTAAYLPQFATKLGFRDAMGVKTILSIAHGNIGEGVVQNLCSKTNMEFQMDYPDVAEVGGV